MNSKNNSLAVRSKILGTLIREARLSCGKTISDCSKYLVLPESEFEAFELGRSSPSLPQLEFLAHFLCVPVDNFWTDKTTPEIHKASRPIDPSRVIKIRDRIIGATIKQARLNEKLSIEDFCRTVDLTLADLEGIELGRNSIGVPQLEIIANTLRLSMQDFKNKEELAGAPTQYQPVQEDFPNLPEDLKVFISKHESLPYLLLAKRLSEISADKLRAIGEGILEITFSQDA